MAVVGTANRGIIIYKLEGKPEMVRNVESPLKYQHRCVAIFRDKKKQSPTGSYILKGQNYYLNNYVKNLILILGFGLGSVEGRVAIQYIHPQVTKDNFTFKCHRLNNPNTMNVQDIYAVCIF